MRPFITSTSIASIVLSVGLVSSPAEARRPQPGRSYSVVVDRLNTATERGQAVIDLEIDPRNWRRLGRVGLHPALNVAVDGQRTRSFVLDDPSTHLVFELHDARGATVSFAARGPSGSVDSMRFGGVELYSMRLRFDRSDDSRYEEDDAPPSPPAPQTGENWAGRREVIDACGQATRDPERCLDAVAHARFDPTRMIGACRESMATYEQTLDCIQVAAAGRTDTVGALRACRDGMNTYDNVLGCYRNAIRARFEPTRTIATCRDAANTYDLALQCVGVTMQATRDPSDIVQSCRAAIRTYDQLIGCIQRALP